MFCTFDDIQLECLTATVSHQLIPVTERLSELLTERKAERLQKGTGFRSLSIAEKEICTSDMCQNAIERLLAKGFFKKEDIGVILFISQTPDYLSPSTSHVLHGKLGLSEDTVAMDIELGCSGFAYGIYLAANLLSSTDKKILICGGDTSSRNAYPNDTSMYAIAGDAGFAAVMGHSPVGEHKKIYCNITTDGSKADYLIVPRGGYRAYRKTDTDGKLTLDMENYVSMDGMGVMEYTINEVPKNIVQLLNYAEKTSEDISLAVVHQAQKMIVGTLADKLNIPREKMPFNAGSFGNTSSASCPLCLSEMEKQGVQIAKDNLLLSGFGVGMSTASVFMNKAAIQVLETGVI